MKMGLRDIGNACEVCKVRDDELRQSWSGFASTCSSPHRHPEAFVMGEIFNLA